MVHNRLQMNQIFATIDNIDDELEIKLFRKITSKWQLKQKQKKFYDTYIRPQSFMHLTG